MTDERLSQFVMENAIQSPEFSDWVEIIRLALAEREREIAEWVRDNQDTVMTFEHDERGLTYVAAADLLAFLKGEK